MKYSFVDGNKDNTFCIDGMGQLYLARHLDREKVSQYQLKVRVELGKNADETTVNVDVADYNDDPPHFDRSVIEIKVAENTSKTMLPYFTMTSHSHFVSGTLLLGVN